MLVFWGIPTGLTVLVTAITLVAALGLIELIGRPTALWTQARHCWMMSDRAQRLQSCQVAVRSRRRALSRGSLMVVTAPGSSSVWCWRV